MRVRVSGIPHSLAVAIVASTFAGCSGGGSSPTPRSETTPTALPTSAPTAAPTATGAGSTATPTPAPSSSGAVGAALVSGQPIDASVGGYMLALTFDAAAGTTFPASARVNVGATLGLAAGAPAPQAIKRRFTTASNVLVTVQFSFTSNVSVVYSLSSTIPGAASGDLYTAETFDSTTGSEISSIVSAVGTNGTVVWYDATAFQVVAGHQYVTEIFASPATSTPSPTAPPTPQPAVTPTGAPPSTALFTANQPGGGVAEYDATTGALYQTFDTSLSTSLVGADDAGNIYTFGNGEVSKLAIGASSTSATYTPTSTIAYGLSVTPGGEVVVAGVSGSNVIFDEWDAGKSGAPSRTLTYSEPTSPEVVFALAPNGTLYIPYLASGGIQKFDQIAAGTITVERTYSDVMASHTAKFEPNVMAAASNGVLYVGEWAYSSSDVNAGMYVFAQSGAESKVTSMAPGIVGIDFDANGNVYVASNNAHFLGSQQTADTAEQLSVYSAGGASLKQQIADGVPAVDGLTVSDSGTAYLVQVVGFGTNGPATNGAIYTVAPGATSATDLIPSTNGLNAVLYDGMEAKSARTARTFHAGFNAGSTPMTVRHE